MERFIGIFGIIVILGLAYLLSNNRQKINFRTVSVGLALQFFLALVILKTAFGQQLFQSAGNFINLILAQAEKGAAFVFGPLAQSDLLKKAFGPGNNYIFFFKIVPTIIFVAVLVNIFYHIGILQRIVYYLGKGMKKLMGVSGVEALSNVSSTFVGQVEAQIMIKPYIKDMTNSELMASMAGSFACIAGGVMALYISLGVPAPYLLAASLMAAPGALVISKIMFPETEPTKFAGDIRLSTEKSHVNLLDAIASGSAEGLKVGLNVVAMLIGFIALISLIDLGFGYLGEIVHIPNLSMNLILGYLFSGFAFVMGVPGKDILAAGSLMGEKMVMNEFVAYLDMIKLKESLDPKTIAITSFALCGFANFSSIAIQIGGIGELAPSRRKDLAKLGIKALIAGTLASYLSATFAGILF